MPTSDIASRLTTVICEWRETLLAIDSSTARHKPSPERWSIAEVMGHLIDSACNNQQRFVRAQSANSLTFPKYDQNTWVVASHYNQSDWLSLVEFWYRYNEHLAQLIRHIPESTLTTVCTITPYEPCTLEFLVVDYLDHLNHHLDKIQERIAG